MTTFNGDYFLTTQKISGGQVDHFRALEGSVVTIGNLELLDTYSGPSSFDHCVLDFHSIFSNRLNASISTKECNDYVTKNKQWFHVVGNRKKVNGSLKTLLDIANKPVDSVKSLGLDVVYRQSLADLSYELGKYVDGVQDKDEMIVVPLRGGLLIASLLPNFDVRRVIPIDCKRLPMNDKIGHFAFGMSFRYFSERTKSMLYDKYLSSRDTDLQILEVAVGSGITTSGIMLDLYLRGVKPKKVRLISPLVTIIGIQFIEEVARLLGIELEVYTSAYFPRLGNFYLDRNDSILDENGRYIVGNASDILSSFLHLDDLDSIFGSNKN